MCIFTILLLLANSTLSFVFEYEEHPKHTLNMADKSIICLPGYISIKNTPESMKTYQLNTREFENIKNADESEYEKYCSRLDERYIGFEEGVEEKEWEMCIDKETNDFVLIYENLNILFSEKKSKPFNNEGTEDWQFKGMFVSFDDYNNMLPNNQFARCLQFHGIHSDQFQNYMVYANDINIPETDNCPAETIEPFNKGLFSISSIHNQRFFGANVYDLKNYLEHRCDEDICKNNCRQNEIYVINRTIKNIAFGSDPRVHPDYKFERVTCTKESYKAFPVPKSEIYCACEALDYKNSGISKYPRKTRLDFECKEGFFSTKYNYFCPPRGSGITNRLCIRPICPLDSCPNQNDSICKFSLGKNKKTGKEKVIDCYLRSDVLYKFSIRTMSFCPLPDWLLPGSFYENNECLYAKEDGETFLETKCVLNAPRGKVFKINDTYLVLKNFEIDCDKLPNSLSLETIKCLKRDFKEEHKKINSCDEEINLGQICEAVCEEGYIFKEKGIKNEVVTCNEGDRYSNTGNLEYLEKYTCIKKPVEKPEEIDETKNDIIEDEDEGIYQAIIYVVVSLSVLLFVAIIFCIVSKRKDFELKQRHYVY